MSAYCRVLGVTPQGYANFVKAQERPYKYAELLANIEEILAEDIFNKNYGKIRMHEKLQLDYNCPHCYNTIQKVMKENGIKLPPKRPKGLTKADKTAQKSDNLLNRNFKADAPNKVLVTDITEYQAYDGKVYTSGIFDCFDNNCIGFATADHMRAELVVETYKNAACRYDLTNAISHSDRGSQYTSTEFRKIISELKIQQSMNSAAGRCHDNAKCESMWARGKVEILACYDTKKMTCEELTEVLHYYFTVYWNHRRICSAIGGVPPMVKRGAYYEKLANEVA